MVRSWLYHLLNTCTVIMYITPQYVTLTCVPVKTLNTCIILQTNPLRVDFTTKAEINTLTLFQLYGLDKYTTKRTVRVK